MAVLIQTEVNAVAEEIDGCRECLGKERNCQRDMLVDDAGGRRELADVRHDIFEPCIWGKQFSEPGGCCGLSIDGAVVDFTFWPFINDGYCDGRLLDQPWKCTPASGWLRARSSRGAQVSLSHSAAGEPRIETLAMVSRAHRIRSGLSAAGCTYGM